jgi:hypothetical protein
MIAWRNWVWAGTVLVLASGAQAQPYSLVETPKVDDCLRYRIDMKLTGEIRVTKDDRQVPLTLTATASHEFPERVLQVNGGLPQKTARLYETAKATIAVNGDRSERGLRPDRCLMVAQSVKDQLLVYCPAGALTRDELDVTEHLDTLSLTGLLPGKTVSVGETWKVPNAVVQALCGFEGMTNQDLTAKLEEVKNNVARFSVNGTTTGIYLGALGKLTINATCRFDLTKHRLTQVEWQQKDERDQGPASPASTVQSTATLTRSVLDEQPKSLDDVALVAVPDDKEPPLQVTQLYCRDGKDRFHLLYGREWHINSRTDEHLVMRLMDRGDWVAQVTVTPWAKAEPGKHMTGEQFQEAMAETPGWESEQVLQVGEVPLDGDRWCYRISALGQLEDQKVMQNFYLVASPQGEQVVLLFTMKQSTADKLGTRDLSLVGSLDFPSNAKKGE